MNLKNIYTAVERIAQIQKNDKPNISKAAFAIMCADNGCAEKEEKSVAELAVKTAGRDSSYSSFIKAVGADHFTVNAGIRERAMSEWLIDRKTANGTKNLFETEAMSAEGTAFAVRSGIELVKSIKTGEYKIMCAASLNSGGYISAEAVLFALTGYKDVSENVKDAVKKYKFRTPTQILQTVGSFELAAMTGLFLGGVLCDMPVFTDDDISAVAALMAYAIEPRVKDYVVALCAQSEISRQIYETLGISAALDISSEIPIEGSAAVFAAMKTVLAGM